MKKLLSKTNIVLAVIFLMAAVSATWLARLYREIPTYEDFTKSFKLSNSFLYAQDGRLINSTRLNFDRKNLVWTPYPQISPQLIETLI
ncbi:MAG: hypothetical protein K2P92_06430, partial [Bdellovibrionaceae bacterium]|nr:hypothetical protein [Pseudobdellovibrionaceae bacterium]